MYKNIRFLPLIVLVFATSCINDDKLKVIDPNIRPLSSSEGEIANSSNNFTFDLMTEIEKEYPNENYFLSAFSVSTALSMVMNGASGTSQADFIEVLGLGTMSPKAINDSYKSLVEYIYALDPSVTLNVANSNWYSDEFTINAGFEDTLATYYDAEVFERDFGNPSTLNALNRWVEDETNGKIKNILDAISPNDVMFLINAIYFKAEWTNQFDKKDTRDLPFSLASGQQVDVPMMNGDIRHWWVYDSSLEAQIIEIPYGNENYAFTIIMPDDVASINGLVSQINSSTLNEVLADTTTLQRELFLPKFKLEFKTDLLTTLVDMGMPVIGLDNLFEEDLPLEITKVIHQSFLEVNEEGSEAAAATVIGVELTSLPAVTTIDQPFVFLIRERNSGTILFSGKLMDPR